MGAVGSSADNAAAESFNAAFKRETLKGRKGWPDERQARLDAFRWLTRYNTRRRHSRLGQRSPIAYENDLQPTATTLAQAAWMCSKSGVKAPGRLTLGLWHVLADNQLVSGENLVRNLLTARRLVPGTLARVGYSPDAFGHPADLPRLLRGFGMDTALVWRGAPDGVARFRWRSPDGSEVFAVNQGYHGAELLWADGPAASDSAERLRDFLHAEHARLPDGPWLLMNGGDHLAPSGPGERIREAAAGATTTDAVLHESTLEDFFTAARTAADARGAAGEPLPVIEGELREPAGYLTFILPGTLSARTYLKQANASAQNLLER